MNDVADSTLTESAVPAQNAQVPGVTGDDLQRQIDALSLSQALLDFEMANVRVLDLTARLVEANDRAARFTKFADDERVRRVEADARSDAAHAQAQATHDAATQARADVEHLRMVVAALNTDLDAHRGVIAARDADAALLHSEIAARDEVIRIRTNEIDFLRAGLMRRFARRFLRRP